jgi:hypothetical protein
MPDTAGMGDIGDIFIGWHEHPSDPGAQSF